jgi:hypothetical protein
MGAGPIIAAAGILWLSRLQADVGFLRDLIPALLLLGLGFAVAVAPLTAAVLADAGDQDAGIASAVNNAVARVAGLIGVSMVGIVVAGSMVGDTFARNSESIDAFQRVMIICAVLLAAGGITGLIGIVNPPHPVDAEGCPGGQFVGAPVRVTTTE